MDWADIEYPGRLSGGHRALWWTWAVKASVFPCGVVESKRGGSWTKQPFISGWQKKENCASSAEEVVKLWDGRVGAECGVLLNDFVLVDLDTKEGWYDGKSEFKKLVAKAELDLLEVLKGAIFYETPGRSGGVHILWKRPDNAKSHKKSVPAAGVEVLGNAHYMLAPCSRRPDKLENSEYKLLGYPERLQLTTPPVELWTLLKKNQGQGNRDGSCSSSKPSLEFALSCSDEGVVLAGLRHDVLYKEAARRAVAGGDEFEVISWLQEILNADPAVLLGVEDFSGEELERMARNAVKWANGMEESDSDQNFNLDLIVEVSEFARKVKIRQQDETQRSIDRWVRGRKWQST